MIIKKSDFSKGWERVMNSEAIRYYQQRQQKRTTNNPDTMWYRKWVGPFAMLDYKIFNKGLAGANVSVDHVVYDASGYVIVPKSALSQ